MTDNRMVLIELIEKGAAGDLVREPLAFTAERTMALEVEGRTGVAAGARSPASTTTDTMMFLAAKWPPWEGSMEEVRVADADAAVLIAVELSKASWLLAVHDPSTDRVSRRGVEGGDADGLIGIVERYRREAQQRTGGTVSAECVFEAGYDGFWLQRRLARAGSRAE